MTIIKVEGDNRPHILEEYFITLNKTDIDKGIDEVYISTTYKEKYPDNSVSTMYLTNSPIDEEWYEVTIMTNDEYPFKNLLNECIEKYNREYKTI